MDWGIIWAEDRFLLIQQGSTDECIVPDQSLSKQNNQESTKKEVRFRLKDAQKTWL